MIYKVRVIIDGDDELGIRIAQMAGLTEKFAFTEPWYTKGKSVLHELAHHIAVKPWRIEVVGKNQDGELLFEVK
jgi:hypothetical protein